ncbi:hypothetical protein N9D45_01610 [Gammaproteobacteria bacterium]|nr:hypothetical protein [Gammaproteobacteria bacterium]
MSDLVKKMEQREKFNTALNVVAVAQTAAMTHKLGQLQQAQTESNQIAEQIVSINTQVLAEQKNLATLGKKNLDEQAKQTKILEIQTKLSQFKIDQDFQEKKEDKASKAMLSNMKEVVFQASIELEAINSSDKHKIEKFFQLQTLKTDCLTAGVSTEGVDDFESKKYISDCLTHITTSIDDTMTMSDDEKQDLEEILDILSVDEEQVIKDEVVDVKKIEKDLADIEKQINNDEELFNEHKKRISHLREKL